MSTEIIYSPHFSYEMRKEGVDKTLKRWEEKGLRFTVFDDGTRIRLQNPQEITPPKPLEK